MGKLLTLSLVHYWSNILKCVKYENKNITVTSFQVKIIFSFLLYNFYQTNNNFGTPPEHNLVKWIQNLNVS